jgi:hypothetical protein
MTRQAPGRFRPACDPHARQPMLLDMRSAEVWPGRWHGREFRIDLIKDVLRNRRDPSRTIGRPSP